MAAADQATEKRAEDAGPVHPSGPGAAEAAVQEDASLRSLSPPLPRRCPPPARLSLVNTINYRSPFYVLQAPLLYFLLPKASLLGNCGDKYMEIPTGKWTQRDSGSKIQVRSRE